MKNDLNLKQIDDLIYLEGSSFENLKKNEIKEISDVYLKKLEKNQKQLKKDDSLFLYDYRPSPIDFNDPNWRKAKKDIEIKLPAIQPHDSTISFIDVTDGVFRIKGFGTSYMNYEDYDFDINFSGVEGFSISDASYSNIKKDSSKNISAEELNSRISGLIFREVFLDESEKLKKEISFVFIDYSDEDIDNEKRSVIVVKFEYEGVNVNCKEIKKQNKNKP